MEQLRKDTGAFRPVYYGFPCVINLLDAIQHSFMSDSPEWMVKHMLGLKTDRKITVPGVTFPIVDVFCGLCGSIFNLFVSPPLHFGIEEHNYMTLAPAMPQARVATKTSNETCLGDATGKSMSARGD